MPALAARRRLVPDIAHLFATNWKALFDCLSLGAFLGNLRMMDAGKSF